MPGADRIPHLLSALSAVDLAHVADGDVSAHFLEHGHRFLDAAMVGPGVLRERAPTDRREWRKRLIEDSVRACADAGPALGLGLLAAALDALDEFGDALPGRCLSGLETWIRGQLQREAQRRQPGALGAQERVMYGLIGQDAARRLGAPELAGRWRHQASEALDVLQISAGLKDVPTTELAELLPLFRRELNFQQEGSLVYPALAAALRLSEADALTAEPAVVVRLCFDLLGKAL